MQFLPPERIERGGSGQLSSEQSAWRHRDLAPEAELGLSHCSVSAVLTPWETEPEISAETQFNLSASFPQKKNPTSF